MSEHSSFEKMLSEFRDRGYRVKRVNEIAAIVFNNGVDPDYPSFDNRVATTTFEERFSFRAPHNADKLYNAAFSSELEVEESELYIGVFKGDDPYVLEGHGYKFK